MPMAAGEKNNQLKWSIEQGSSQSGLLSEETLVTCLEIRPNEVDIKGIRRLWTTVPDRTRELATIIERATQLASGHSLLATVKPELAAFRPGGDEYNNALQLLDDEAKRPHKVFLKTAHPTKRMKENLVEYIPYHFVLDIDHSGLVDFVVSRFRTFEMLQLLILGIDADEQEIANQLQGLYLGRNFLLDDLLEEVQVLGFFDYFGERLYLESASDQVIRRIAEDFQVTPEERGISGISKQSKSTHHSIWWGRRKLFEW